MPFAYGYVRVSTPRQNATGYSMEHQRDQVFIKFNASYRDTHHWGGAFSDGGVSASKKKILERTAGKQLHDKLNKGDVIIVTRINRICRNLRDFTTMLEYWDSIGVGFVCTADPVDTSNNSPFGRFIVQLMGAIAELESGLISERIAESHAVRLKQGLPNGIHPLLYYWGGDKLLHVFQPELEAAELFFRMRSNQSLSLSKIRLWTLKTRYHRKKKRGQGHRNGNKRAYNKEWNISMISCLIELYRRVLWLQERGVDVFGREYLDATARGETPMRPRGMTPPELLENRYAPIGVLAEPQEEEPDATRLLGHDVGSDSQGRD